MSSLGAMFPQLAGVSSGLNYGDNSAIMGGLRGSIGLRQNKLALNSTKVLADAGLPLGSVLDTNNPVNTPIANITTVVPWAISRQQAHWDTTPGQCVFAFRDTSFPSSIDPSIQPHHFRSPGPLNNYFAGPMAHKLYGKIEDGYTIGGFFPHVGIQQTKNMPENTAVGNMTSTRNFEIGGVSETHNYWLFNQSWDDSGINLMNPLKPFDSIFWVYKKEPRFSLTELDAEDEFGYRFMDPKDRYQWTVMPWHNNGGGEQIKPDMNYFSDLNEGSDNYHKAHAVCIGVCIGLINRFEDHDAGMTSARLCLYPKKVDAIACQHFNILPRIQINLGIK